MSQMTPEVNPQAESEEQTSVDSEKRLFPHDIPTEHWDVDFGNSHDVYEGTALPIWILAGWAAFILWAIVYLFSGLPTAF